MRKVLLLLFGPKIDCRAIHGAVGKFNLRSTSSSFEKGIVLLSASSSTSFVFSQPYPALYRIVYDVIKIQSDDTLADRKYDCSY